MRRRSKEESKRWFEQADFELESAKRTFENEIYSYTCFMCEQAAQKALKAYLIFKGERYIWEHSIQELAEKCSNFDGEFSEFVEFGVILDKYYLTTRYPDAIAPPAIPYKSFTEKEGSDAIKMVEKILGRVRVKLR